MRARWDFLFECTGIRFDRIYKYQAQISNKQAETFGLPAQGFDALITIEPDEESYNPMADQTGKLKIILPGNNIQTRNLALWLSQYVAQQSMFLEHEMHITYGLIIGEHLPDTSEEAEQLRDAPWFSEAHIVEVEPKMEEEGEEWPVFPMEPDSVTTEKFKTIERGELQSEEDINLLLWTLFIEPECPIYYYFEKDLPIDSALRAASDRGDILMRKTELKYYRHPNFNRDYIRIFGKDSKGVCSRR